MQYTKAEQKKIRSQIAKTTLMVKKNRIYPEDTFTEVVRARKAVRLYDYKIRTRKCTMCSKKFETIFKSTYRCDSCYLFLHNLESQGQGLSGGMDGE